MTAIMDQEIKSKLSTQGEKAKHKLLQKAVLPIIYTNKLSFA